MTRINGDIHRDVAASYGNMGVELMKMAKYEEALVMYSKSLEIDIRVHGDSHLLVADTWNKMMMPLFVLTETINSLPLYTHLGTPVGVVYFKKGNRAAATEMYIKASDLITQKHRV
jgi:tetratricopeptide (TPR) repeat protein